MPISSTRAGLIVAALMPLSLVLLGCTSKTPETKVAQTKAAATPSSAAPAAESTAHAGWWCDEHGIPEEECSMCSAKVAREFKAKGDWCEKHDRAKSQCFICNPALKEKYAAKYRAKYGADKNPPPIKDEDEKADEKGNGKAEKK